MSEARNAGGPDAEQSGQSVIAVPANLAQAVLDFIASLESEEEGEVSGYLINTGLVTDIGGALSAKKRTTGSGCVWDPLQKKFVCGDLD